MRLSSPPEQKQDRSGFQANSSHNPHTVSRQGKELGEIAAAPSLHSAVLTGDQTEPKAILVREIKSTHNSKSLPTSNSSLSHLTGKHTAVTMYFILPQ